MTPAALLDLKRMHWARLCHHRQLGSGGVQRLLAESCAEDVLWHGPAPLDDVTGRQALLDSVWEPLIDACPDLEDRVDILLCGAFKDGGWLTTIGHYVGIFTRPWLGIQPSGRPLWLRYGRFDRFEAGRIVETFQILDIPGAMMQAGCWPLSPGLGRFGISPAPASFDGVNLAGVDEGESRASMALVEAMMAGLMRYDGKSLSSMGMVQFWTPMFHWYGPAGIGSLRGHQDYERGHQRPFLTAFPDRVGGDHKCRIADNAYVASTGWPSVRATHLGGGWLGLAPTGKRIGMRVMDVWRREDDRLAENWVYIDLIDLLRQMDIDVFARMREMTAG